MIFQIIQLQMPVDNFNMVTDIANDQNVVGGAHTTVSTHDTHYSIYQSSDTIRGWDNYKTETRLLYITLCC